MQKGPLWSLAKRDREREHFSYSSIIEIFVVMLFLCSLSCLIRVLKKEPQKES